MPHDGSTAENRSDRPRVVTLVHGRHRWRFTCAIGEERELVAAAAAAAMRGASGLDLADAAILARRLGAWSSPEDQDRPSADDTD